MKKHPKQTPIDYEARGIFARSLEEALQKKTWENTQKLIYYVSVEAADAAIAILESGQFDPYVLGDIAPFAHFRTNRAPVPLHVITWCQVILHRLAPSSSASGCLKLAEYWRSHYQIDMSEKHPLAFNAALAEIKELGMERRRYKIPKDDGLPSVIDRDVEWLLTAAACAQCYSRFVGHPTLLELMRQFSPSDDPATMQAQLEQMAKAVLYGGYFLVKGSRIDDKERIILPLEIEFNIRTIENASQETFYPSGSLVPTPKGVLIAFDDCKHHRYKASILFRGYRAYSEAEPLYINKDKHYRYYPPQLLEELFGGVISLAGQVRTIQWRDIPYPSTSKVRSRGMILSVYNKVKNI